MPPRPESLRAAIAGQRRLPVRTPSDAFGCPTWAGAPGCRSLAARNVLLRTSDQLFAALALIELDGVAARIVIAPPDLKPEHLAGM